MAFKNQGKDIVSKVFGFGTGTSYSNFSTSTVSGLKIGGVQARAVPKSDLFMPFSDTGFEGYRSGGENIFTSGAFAGVHRFIVSNTPRITHETVDGDFELKYEGGGTYNSLGKLYRGSTLMSSSCPPVILVALQAAGGNGGNGVMRENWFGYVNAGGGGGASGGFTCFQMRLPHTATSPTRVARFAISSGSISFYGTTNSLLGTVRKGNNGGNGWADIAWTGVAASAGAGGGGTALSSTMYALPSNFSNANILSSSGDNRPQFIDGKAGGKGGVFFVTFGGTDSNSTAGGTFSGTRIILNSATENNSLSGGFARTGSTGAGRGGGGASSMRGSTNQNYNTAQTGFAQGGYGAGGHGGGGQGANLTPGKGGLAAIQFYW